MCLAAFIGFLLHKIPGGRKLLSDKRIEFSCLYSFCTLLLTFFALVIITQLPFFLFSHLQLARSTPLAPGTYKAPLFLVGDWLTCGWFVGTVGLAFAGDTLAADGVLRFFKVQRKRALLSLACPYLLPVVAFVGAIVLLPFFPEGVRGVANDRLTQVIVLSVACTGGLGSVLSVFILSRFDKYKPSGTIAGTMALCLFLCFIGVPTAFMFLSLGSQ